MKTDHENRKIAINNVSSISRFYLILGLDRGLDLAIHGINITKITGTNPPPPATMNRVTGGGLASPEKLPKITGNVCLA